MADDKQLIVGTDFGKNASPDRWPRRSTLQHVGPISHAMNRLL